MKYLSYLFLKKGFNEIVYTFQKIFMNNCLWCSQIVNIEYDHFGRTTISEFSQTDLTHLQHLQQQRELTWHGHTIYFTHFWQVLGSGKSTGNSEVAVSSTIFLLSSLVGCIITSIPVVLHIYIADNDTKIL